MADLLRVPVDEVRPAVERLARELREAAKRPREGDRATADRLVSRAEERDGVRVVAEVVDVPDARALLELSDQVKQRLGAGAVVLGTAVDGRVHLVANVAPAAVERGVKAGEIVRAAAKVVGGGGGGRDTMAQAGGRDPEKLPEAIAAARLGIERALA
jgi:alanyl-tRNA synthetase